MLTENIPTREELVSTPQVLGVNDIMKMHRCGRNKAYAILHSIRAYYDDWDEDYNCRCLVTVPEYIGWLNRPRNRK